MRPEGPVQMIREYTRYGWISYEVFPKFEMEEAEAREKLAESWNPRFRYQGD